MNTVDTSLVAPITNTSWWRNAFTSYSDSLFSQRFKRALILYNADIDGFAASYFVWKLLEKRSIAEPPISFHAIWNYEYDFSWLPRLVSQSDADLIVGVDLPIIQEPEILRQLSSKTQIIIYDHHVVPRMPSLPSNITFLNSRVLGLPGEDHPASGFAGAAALLHECLVANDLLVMAAGLHGDLALDKYSELSQFASTVLEEPSDCKHEENCLLVKFSSQMDTFFAAYPGRQISTLQCRLSAHLASESARQALMQFAQEFGLEEAAHRVAGEVEEFLYKLTREAESFIADGVFLAVPPIKTFSGGILATALANQRMAPIVAIGFETDDRVQFELRIAPDSAIDLASLLKRQRFEFAPVTSGGHPMAAGALVWKKDIQLFADSLRHSL